MAKKKISLREINQMNIQGAMAINTTQLLRPGANPLHVLEGGIGIGVAGIVSDRMFELVEPKKRKRRR